MTVSVTVPSGTDVTVDKPTLTFMQDTWSVPQTVTVMAKDDDDAADDEVVLRHRGSGGDYNGLQGDSLEVTVDDDDLPDATVSTRTLSVPEGGNNSYTVVLDFQPTAPVTVDLTTDPVNPDLSVSPSRLTFTRTNWSNAKTVRVSAREDGDSVTDPPVTLMHDFSGGDYGRCDGAERDGDHRGERHAGRDAVDECAADSGRPDPQLHRGSEQPALGERDGVRGKKPVGRGGQPEPDQCDVHAYRLVQSEAGGRDRR